MIGVIASEAERSAVVEFFELFKTPWEFHRPGAHYDVLLCSNSLVPENSARLLLLYGAQRQAFEECRSMKTRPAPGHDFVSFRDERMPIYGSCLLFDRPCNAVLVHILPVPAGHRFIVCLTHDVDHPCVRYHKCDRTMFGFLFRALVGSVINFCRGRRSLRQVAINWKAAFSLPLVFAGLAKDFWNQLDRYLELERHLASTFFVIPTKGEAGVDSHGRTRAKRASRYASTDIADDLKRLLSANREIGVHGIDAWRDIAKARDERKGIQEITGADDIGVRMHWLYFNSQAPLTLEKAGFSYDSTAGYNETIGYRAGTAQVFKHANVDSLLELPLPIMDTA